MRQQHTTTTNPDRDLQLKANKAHTLPAATVGKHISLSATAFKNIAAAVACFFVKRTAKVLFTPCISFTSKEHFAVGL